MINPSALVFRKISLSRMFIYVVLSLGAYYFYWLNRVINDINSLDEEQLSKSGLWFLLVGVLSSIFLLNSPYRVQRLIESEQYFLIGLLCIVLFGCFYMSTKLILTIRKKLVSMVHTGSSFDSRFNVLAVIALNIFYLQYKINRHL